MTLCAGPPNLECEDSSSGEALSPTEESSMLRYITGSGTTTELVVLQVIVAAIWSANLHFHWFQ
jgi:hypothetical protein